MLGIAGADWIWLTPKVYQDALQVGLVSIVLLFLLSNLRPAFRERARFGILVFIVIAGFGFLRLEQSQQWERPAHFAWQREQDTCGIWAEVLDSRPGANSYRVLLQVRALQATPARWKVVQGKLLAYLKPSRTEVLPQAGQYLYLRGRIDTTVAALNPDAFDFRAYLRRQGIHHQTFAPEGAWQIDTAHSSRTLPQVLQQFCLQVLTKHLPRGDTYAVGAALILGERSQLSTEVKQAYSNTGAVHVLSVSGLHVGILALVLRWLFASLGGSKMTQKLGLGLELSSIWLFTLLTGAAPATLRAALMFSLIIGARAVLRQYNIWNILAASAFGLLCWEPNLLWDIGFQLSYLALGGIVAFQQWIYQRWSPSNAALDYVWKLSSVGIAAQLSTGPLSIYYFHQFPLFFWLSGIVAVPLSGLILILGLGLFVLEALQLPAFYVGKILALSIEVLNYLIGCIQDFPLAVWSGFCWDAWATLGVYAVLLLLCLAVSRRRLRYLNLALGLSLLWALSRWPALFAAQGQHQVICYHIPKASLLEVVQGRNAVQMGTADTLAEIMAAQNHRFRLRLRPVRRLTWGQDFNWGAVCYKWGCLDFFGQKIACLDGHEPLLPTRCRYLLLCNNPRIYPEELPQGLRLIILDGSNRWGTRQWVKKMAATKGIQVHDTAENGAWVLSP
jgi:competence protein ComEC